MAENSLIVFIKKLQPMLPNEKLPAIASLFEYRELKKNEFFIREGAVCDQYCFLESGLIRSYTTNTEGDEVTTGIYPARRIVCELSSFFRRVPAQESYVVMCDSKAWCLSFERIQTAFHALPEFRELGRAILVNEYSILKEKSLAGLHKTAEERYAGLLASEPDIFQHVPLKNIASYLGVTDTSLSRIRKEFAKK